MPPFVLERNSVDRLEGRVFLFPDPGFGPGAETSGPICMVASGPGLLTFAVFLTNLVNPFYINEGSALNARCPETGSADKL